MKEYLVLLSFMFVILTFSSINHADSVEFIDKSGYIPDWATNLDEEGVLNICANIEIGSGDSVWCDEFIEYVNSQTDTQIDAQENLDRVYYVYVSDIPPYADFSKELVSQVTKNWEDANPNLKFYFVDTQEQADIHIQWVKEFGVEHVGYAYGKRMIEVGLGDSNCGNDWKPFAASHVAWILTHEIGHVIGLEHSSDPSDVMYPVAPSAQYAKYSMEVTLAERYLQFLPLCTSSDITSIAYVVRTDDPTYGFDAYIVPSKEEFNKALNGETFSHYDSKGCFGEDYLKYGGVCNGIGKDAGLLIAVDNRQTNGLTKINVDLEEIHNPNQNSADITDAVISYNYPDEYSSNDESVTGAVSQMNQSSENIVPDYQIKKITLEALKEVSKDILDYVGISLDDSSRNTSLKPLDNLLTYEDPKRNFAIQYPSNFQIIENYESVHGSPGWVKFDQDQTAPKIGRAHV